MPLRPIRPAYPPLVGDLAGRVVLLLFINERGKVDTHRVVESRPGDVFTEATVAPFVRETFAPGLITGVAVKSQLLVEVSFEPGSEAKVNILAEPPK